MNEEQEYYKEDKEIQKKLDSPINNLKTIPKTTRILLLLSGATAAWIIYFNNLSENTKMAYIVTVLIIATLLSQNIKEINNGVLTDEELDARLLTTLKRKQRKGQIKQGKIIIGLTGRMQDREVKGEMKPFIRHQQFFIKPIDGHKLEYSAEQCPYTGEWKGCILRPYGFKGDEVKDLKFITSKSLEAESVARKKLGGVIR